jgi:hypothetical protein
VYQVGHRAERGQRLFNEGGAPPSEIAIEGIAQIDGAPMTNDCPRDMRPTDGSASRFLQYAVE